MRQYVFVSFVLTAALCVMLPLGCRQRRTVSKRVLTIISPHNENIKNEFEAAFLTWHTRTYGGDVAIAWLDPGGTTDSVRYIRSEFSKRPQGIDVDLFWGGGVEPYIAFAEEGLLQHYVVPDRVLSVIPKEVAGIPVYDSDHRWYGTALSGFGIIYNKARLRDLKLPVPQTWADLARPEFAGQVAAADPRHSGSAFQAYEIILQAYGWENGFRILLAFAGNVKSHARAASDVPKLVSLQEVVAGPAVDFYAWAQIAEDGPEKIGFVLPQQVTVVNPDCIGILKGAPQLELAQHFVCFVLSDEGQRLWVLPKGHPDGPQFSSLSRIPVLPRVLDTYRENCVVTVDPRQLSAGFKYDGHKAAARRNALKDLLGTQLIDTHPELQRAWNNLIRAGLPERAMAEFCALPVTEEELLDLSLHKWSDPVARNATIAQWSNFAVRKYQKLARAKPEDLAK